MSLEGFCDATGCQPCMYQWTVSGPIDSAELATANCGFSQLWEKP